MGQYNIKVKVNLFRMLVVIVGFGLLAVYATIAFSAQDALWFVGGFSDLPIRIIIYNDGQQTELRAGEPGFDVLANAVRESLDQGVTRQTGIGMSEASLTDAYGKYLTVEAFFEKPVKIPAWFNTGHPNQMLFPLTGRHSDNSVVFLGRDGRYMTNAPALKNLEPLRQALQLLGY